MKKNLDDYTKEDLVDIILKQDAVIDLQQGNLIRLQKIVKLADEQEQIYKRIIALQEEHIAFLKNK